MQSVAAFVLLCALICVADADDVIVGTGKTFDKIVKDNAFVVAEFYAPWCGHCKHLEPEYSKAATALKNEDPPITLVKVDATEEDNKELASKYGVQGFPTLKIFRDGDTERPQDYNGPREAAGIVAYLQKKAGPATKLLSSQAEVEAFKAKDPAIVGVFKDEKSAEFKVFSKTASKLADDYDFAHTFDADIVEGASKPPTTIIFKDGDKSLTFDGKFKSDDLEAWIESKALPILPELDQSPKNKKALSKAFESSKPKLFGFVSKEDKLYQKFTQVLTAAAEAKVGELFFITVDPSSNTHALDFFGLKEADTPAFVLQDGNDKYISRSTAPKKLDKLIKDFEAGDLEKDVKSEDPPKDNSGPVKVVTAKTFNELVLGGKHVLIEFYAPWCGHCKKLAPIYEKVGEAFADNDSVVVAKMDATANDIPSSKFQVKGFPTIFFVSGEDGSIAEYSGDRSEDDLVKYIKSHASSSSTSSSSEEAHSEL